MFILIITIPSYMTGITELNHVNMNLTMTLLKQTMTLLNQDMTLLNQTMTLYFQ